MGQLKAFSSFAAQEGWISESPVNGIYRPQSDTRPTLPLGTDEVPALVRAAHCKPRGQDLLLLLRHSGLAIRDANTFRRDAVQLGDDLVLRRAKSGELVTAALPDQVTAALESVAEPGRAHYFWTGRAADGRELLAREPEAGGRRGRHRGLPPSPPAGHIRRRSALGRPHDPRRLQLAGAQQRLDDRALFRAVECRALQAPSGDRPQSPPTGSDPVGIHTQEARGERDGAPRGGWSGNAPPFPSRPAAICMEDHSV